MSNDDDLSTFHEARQRRVRITAWVVIIALILGGGGATVFALLFGWGAPRPPARVSHSDTMAQ